MGAGGGARGAYLLDTNVLLAYMRGGQLAQRIEAAYSLRANPYKPLISVVTVGEVLAFALWRGWGDRKRAAMHHLLEELVRVDINSQDVLDAYAALDAWALRNGRSLGKNDLRIAATAQVTKAVLLTTDRDFALLGAAGLIQCEVIEVRHGPGGVS